MADYTGDKDIDNLLRELYAKIDDVLRGDFQDLVDKAIQNRVQSNVYDAYDPIMYKRRGKHGGLQDPSKYQHTVSNHTLTVSDNRQEVEVVESGEGYAYPPQDVGARPYWSYAEEDIESDSIYADLIAEKLSK